MRSIKKWPVRLGVRTSPFHGGNAGSIPARATYYTSKTRVISGFCRFLEVFRSDFKSGALDGIQWSEYTNRTSAGFGHFKTAANTIFLWICD